MFSYEVNGDKFNRRSYAFSWKFNFDRWRGKKLKQFKRHRSRGISTRIPYSATPVEKTHEIFPYEDVGDMFKWRS